MTALRRLELSSGVITLVLGLAVALTMFLQDQEATSRLELEFPVYQTIFVGLLFFGLPGFFIFLGSNIHAVKQNSCGRLVLIAGSLASVAIFLRSLVPLVWSASVLWRLLNVLLTMFAILTAVVSLLVRRKDNIRANLHPGETRRVTMTSVRKFELSGGVITAVSGLLALLAFVRQDQAAAYRLEPEFPVYAVLVGSLLFVFPSLLVLTGSYIHSVKYNSRGQLLLMVGALGNVVAFILLFFLSAFFRLDLFFWLNFSLPLFATLTAVVSLLVRRERQHSGESLSRERRRLTMSFLRKLELICGAITAALAVLILLMLIREDQEVAAQLQQDFPLYQSVLVGLLFVIPGLLVLIGSYLDSIKKNSFGQFALLSGALVNATIFLLFFFRGGFNRLNFFFWVMFALPLFAILTAIVSILVRKKIRFRRLNFQA